MPDDGAHRAMLRALNRARPDSTITVLRDVMTKQFGATQVRILLANYQLTAVRPILKPDEPLSLDDSAAGDAFATQKPVVVSDATGKTRVYLPVSVHGDRIGVLQLALPAAPHEEHLDQLTDMATLAGYALTATSKQTDLLHRAARSQRMPLPAELQWQLLPARGCLAPEYELAGHLEPAYAAYADNFDWSENADHLLVSITDATHHARRNPLLTTLAVTAARNARRAGLGIAEQAALSGQALYAHHQGQHCVETIMMNIDVTTGHAHALKAGSPQVVLLRDGELRPIELADQIPLGMFEGTEYEAQQLELATGDRLLFMSDGVINGLSTRARPHPHRLRQILETPVNHHPAAVVRALIDTLMEQHQDNDLDDDATVVCLDWNGPGQPNEFILAGDAVEVGQHKSHLHVVPPTAPT